MSHAALTPADHAFPTVPLMGLDLAAVSERDTINYVLDGLGRRRGGWICPANLDVLRQCRGSADVRELVAAADLVVADGMPLVWAGELQGSPLPGRVAGSTGSSLGLAIGRYKMNCEDVDYLLDAYLDQELEVDQRLAIEQHLIHCRKCWRFAQEAHPLYTPCVTRN